MILTPRSRTQVHGVRYTSSSATVPSRTADLGSSRPRRDLLWRAPVSGRWSFSLPFSRLCVFPSSLDLIARSLTCLHLLRLPAATSSRGQASLPDIMSRIPPPLRTPSFHQLARQRHKVDHVTRGRQTQLLSLDRSLPRSVHLRPCLVDRFRRHDSRQPVVAASVCFR